MNEMLGTFLGSYGYRADGKIYRFRGGEPVASKYGATFAAGDVIGCGLLPAQQEVFYTKNGKYLGVAFKGVMVTTRQ
jgi:hypothetical protein